jgi:DNA-binding NtrC family response regulator
MSNPSGPGVPRREREGPPSGATPLAAHPKAVSLWRHLGDSSAVQRIVTQVMRLARGRHNVLVIGEAGTYKEVVAEALHNVSPHGDAPFLTVNCRTCPEGSDFAKALLERGLADAADRPDRGTLFLHEVDCLTVDAQSHLLRLASEATARGPQPRLRLVSSADPSFSRAVEHGRFHADLGRLLAQRTVRIPSLREHPEDVTTLAERFRELASVELSKHVRTFSKETGEVLRRHSWPGNYSELWNVVYHAIVDSDEAVAPERVEDLIHTPLAEDAHVPEELLRNILRAQTRLFFRPAGATKERQPRPHRKGLAARILGALWSRKAKAESHRRDRS